MFVLGLTGPTGVGKSFASKVFADQGFATVDADKVAHEVVETGSPCLQELAKVFGNDIIRNNGSLNRNILAEKAFSSQVGTGQLNKITHPYIIEKIQNNLLLLKKSGAKAVVLDAPTLFESGADKFCDKVLAVVADSRDLCINRIIARDHLTQVEAERRLSAQPRAEFYMEKADYIIVNHGDSDRFVKEIHEFITRLRDTVDTQKEK